MHGEHPILRGPNVIVQKTYQASAGAGLSYFDSALRILQRSSTDPAPLQLTSSATFVRTGIDMRHAVEHSAVQGLPHVIPDLDHYFRSDQVLEPFAPTRNVPSLQDSSDMNLAARSSPHSMPLDMLECTPSCTSKSHPFNNTWTHSQ
jgi:hypothetical protein